jgi:hypothetical protein
VVYTAFGGAWLNLQWLSSVLFAMSHLAVGDGGLVIVRALLVCLLLAVWTSLALACAEPESRWPAAWLVIPAAFAAIAFPVRASRRHVGSDRLRACHPVLDVANFGPPQSDAFFAC